MLSQRDVKAWNTESPLGRDVPMDEEYIFWILHKAKFKCLLLEP